MAKLKGTKLELSAIDKEVQIPLENEVLLIYKYF